MRVLAVEQQSDAGLGVFEEAIREDGHELTLWKPALGTPAPDGDHDAYIVLGGAMNIEEQPKHPWIGTQLMAVAGWVEGGYPVLGLCLGSQMLATAAGGSARRASEPEIGWFDVTVNGAGAEDPLIGPLAPRFEAFQWHSFECVAPPGSVELARSPVCTQAFRIGERAWGLQFHPEVSRKDALDWIDDYRSDPDAVRIGIDPVALREETEPKLDGWNELGREVCRRFLELAATPA
jgi:GMP synthase-like glutamine amidotransferase